MQGNHEFSDERIPLAYFITFRCYGTWLHGRAGSVDRFHNQYGTPRLIADNKRKQYNFQLLKQPPVDLNRWRRRVVLESIKETCNIRKWRLWASNIRTNHVHTIVSAQCKAKVILNALKANATRKMREAGCWRSDRTPWARRGSKKRLWSEEDLSNASAYVLYEQGVPLPE
jgi:REP element-mobilizing transposase RayT